MATSRLVKDILLDMSRTITELRGKDLLRDEKGITQISNKGNTLEISYQVKMMLVVLYMTNILLAEI